MIGISVIIPVHNEENTIERCINSVLKQTFSEIEIIVINDGSNDNTAKILEKFKEKAVIINQERVGQGYARNVGLGICKGKYIGFLDADDTIDPDMYEKMYKSAEKYHSDVVQCGINDIFDDGRVVTRSVPEGMVEIRNRADYTFDYFYHMKHTNEVCNKLIRSEFMKKNKLSFSDTNIYFSEDYKFNMEVIICLDKISFVEEGLYNYYIKDNRHCLSDLVGRVPKILKIFESVLSNEMDSGTRKAFECVATATILTYCAEIADKADDLIFKILDNKQLKKYMVSSMMYRSSFKHFMLIFVLLNSPKKIKMGFLKKFYNF